MSPRKALLIQGWPAHQPGHRIKSGAPYDAKARHPFKHNPPMPRQRPQTPDPRPTPSPRRRLQTNPRQPPMAGRAVDEQIRWSLAATSHPNWNSFVRILFTTPFPLDPFSDSSLESRRVSRCSPCACYVDFGVTHYGCRIAPLTVTFRSLSMATLSASLRAP